MVAIIFKATEACNARCLYCDVVHKENQVIRKMRPELLDIFYARVNEFLTERPSENAEILWHGGEPLLLGPEFFALAVKLQRKHCAKTSERISYSIQTNLTLFSGKFAEVFRELGIRSVGTSYDPVPDIRGLGKACNSAGYNRRFIEGVSLLEREGMKWGLIYVVTKRSLAKALDIFHFLTNLNPGGGIMFNPVLLYGRNLEHLRISPAEFADFLGAIFPTWWKHRARFPLVEPFTSLTRNLIEKQSSLFCSDSGACAYSHLNLAPDGRVSQCGRSFDWGLLDYGSILDRSISQILADPQRAELLRRNEVLRAGECQGCRFWSICHGGCPLDGWAEGGSLMHKTGWCSAKRRFIEEYFEPAASPAAAIQTSGKDTSPGHSATRVEARSMTDAARTTPNADAPEGPPWIDPIGGLGDTLMISGVLKQVIEADASRKFNLVLRTKYAPLLKGHPAIGTIGHPPPGSRFIKTNYWEEKDYGERRSYQILARMFGLVPPVPETLFVPWPMQDDADLLRAIPWKRHNILIAPASDSPRKQMPAEKWECLVWRLRGCDVNVAQAGRHSDKYIRGCFSLLGLTSPRQIISLLGRFDVVVTSDNFLMHAAHLRNVAAVVLWGPTDHRIYGYAEQIHVQTSPCCSFPKGCIGRMAGSQYCSACPEGASQCMNQINIDDLHHVVRRVLANEEPHLSEGSVVC